MHSSRIAGSKLVFLDVVQDGNRAQGMLNFGKLEAAGISKDEFKKFYHIARRGDIVGRNHHPGCKGYMLIATQRLLAPR